jgi:hypothetical protein
MARGDRFIAGGFRATDVIDALDGATPDLALFTTYTFSPDAFEAQYLRPLQRLGCRRVVVLADPVGLAQSFEQAGDATGIGSDYYLRQVDGWSAYHAKIVLLQAPARAVLAVSSGNLTVSGLLANAEVGGLCALGEPEATAALSRLAASLLAQAGLGTPCEPPREPIEVAPHTRLLTSLGGPILDRLDLPAQVRKIELVSPFVDANASVFNEMAERWPEAGIHLRVDQRFGSLSEDLVRDAQRLGPRARLEVLTLGDEGASAPLVHGKLFVWLSDTEATVVVGSANLSRPALKGGGNFEAVLEHRTGVAQAESLARVPGARWHRAKMENAGGPRPGELASPHPVGALLAECRGRQLFLRWGGGLPEGRLAVRLYRGTLALYEAAVPAPHQLEDCSRVVLNLPVGLLPDVMDPVFWTSG